MTSEELLIKLCDDVGEIKDCLIGTISPPTEGLIGKVAKHGRLFTMVIWLGGVIFAAIAGGCVTLWVR